MKKIKCFLFLLVPIVGHTQLGKQITFSTTVNYDHVLNGMGTNDDAFGLGLDASFFTKHKLTAIVESTAERFIGDKTLRIDTITGEHLKNNAAILSIKAGPQVFLLKQLAVSVSCGPAWHILNETNYSLDLGFRYSLTGFLGNQRKFVAKFFLVTVTSNPKIKYLGFAIGSRF